MTPAINLLNKTKTRHTIHSYEHDTASSSYGSEAAEKLGLTEDQVFKTLIVELDSKELITAVVPVSRQLSLKAIAKISQAKKANMADKAMAEKATGYILGGVSPVGQKKRLRTFIDESSLNRESIFVSAGRRGLEIEMDINDLVAITSAKIAAIAS